MKNLTKYNLLRSLISRRSLALSNSSLVCFSYIGEQLMTVEVLLFSLYIKTWVCGEWHAVERAKFLSYTDQANNSVFIRYC